MNLRSFALLPLLALAPACGNSERSAAGAASGNSATTVGIETGGKSLGGEPVKLDKLKFGGSGFEAEFNAALDSWTVEKFVPNDMGGKSRVMRIYVDMWNSDWPKAAADFAQKAAAKDFLDMGSTFAFEAPVAFDGGWVLTGTTDSGDGEPKRMVFAMRLDKIDGLCRGYVDSDVPEANRVAIRDDAIAGCKGASLP